MIYGWLLSHLGYVQPGERRVNWREELAYLSCSGVILFSLQETLLDKP